MAFDQNHIIHLHLHLYSVGARCGLFNQLNVVDGPTSQAACSESAFGQVKEEAVVEKDKRDIT